VVDPATGCWCHRCRSTHWRGQGRIGRLPMPQRPLHRVAKTLPTPAARRAECRRTQRRAPGEPGERV